MDSPVITPPSSYAPEAGRFDEMLDAGTGAPREHWSHLAEAFSELGTEELMRRRDEGARLLDQDGVVYNAYGEGSRSWKVDPLPTVISSREWQAIESAVIERAELLNLVLDDLYGDRDLLRRGLLPPEIVFGHAGFLRACDGVRLPGPAQLFGYAADLGRDADGRWCVLGDRTQTPSGFGYALENRTVISRVLPSLYRDANVHRLAPFFRALRSALQAAAPPGVDDPRIVVLTPGPWNETAFEHAVLSSTLGFPLVEGSDLVVRGDGVWMGSLGALEPVHVILRRVDGAYCDPLELRPDSQLGVAGLVEATRRGTVSVVNTLGSSVLENPALLPFLPRIGEHLLGRTPRMASVPTWWCGDEAERRRVLERLDEIVLRPVSRGAGSAAILGWELSAAERDELRARIGQQPAMWVGQEPLALATTPTLGDHGLQARRSVLRTFAVARRDSYTVMPGGLTRVAAEGDDGRSRISNQTGAVSKDTWVLASEPERQTGFWLEGGPAVEGVDPMASLSARAAENLWWLGRYAERAEATVRLLRAVNDRRNEFQGGDDPAGEQALGALLAALSQATSTGAGGPSAIGPADASGELLSLLVDERRPGTVAHAVRSLLQCAYAVRDQLSGDTWLVVGSLDQQILRLRRRDDVPAPAVQATLQRLMQGLLALGGLGEESMVRDLGWRFLDGGRRLERAIQLLWLVRSTLTESRGVATDSLVLESTLTASESIITYRRRYRSRAQLETALELLLLDEHNPRSLAYQLARLTDDLAALPVTDGTRLRADQRQVLEASTTLALTDPSAMASEDENGRRPALDALLSGLLDRLLSAADELERAHFVHRLPQQSLGWAGPLEPGL
ncbi:MAG: circularly permuted type 2 ATP-grasp protein [Solirubrobacteraceae bacterium]|nr:circularly permuted type 2 ATP-grasp protein [Solirubrobacteraceae bacterium]